VDLVSLEEDTRREQLSLSSVKYWRVYTNILGLGIGAGERREVRPLGAARVKRKKFQMKREVRRWERGFAWKQACSVVTSNEDGLDLIKWSATYKWCDFGQVTWSFHNSVSSSGE
jgi:hypothetical protein